MTCLSLQEEEFLSDLTLYALDVLEPEEAADVRRHVETCEACRNEVEALQAAAALGIPERSSDSTHARVKERLMNQIANPLEQPLPGVFVLRENAGCWEPTPFPGVSFKQLYKDRQTHYITSLVRIEAGAQYPAHHHNGVEQCLVLQGKVRIGEIELSGGDFEYAQANTDHGIVRSEAGCLLLIVSYQHDELYV